MPKTPLIFPFMKPINGNYTVTQTWVTYVLLGKVTNCYGYGMTSLIPLHTLIIASMRVIYWYDDGDDDCLFHFL